MDKNRFINLSLISATVLLLIYAGYFTWKAIPGADKRLGANLEANLGADQGRVESKPLTVYKNELYGFEVFTPFEVREDSSSDIVFCLSSVNWEGGVPCFFDLHVRDNPKQLGLGDFVKLDNSGPKNYLVDCGASQSGPVSEKPIRTGDISGIKLGPYCNNQYVAYLAKNKTVYVLHSAYSEESGIDNIISTFRIIK